MIIRLSFTEATTNRTSGTRLLQQNRISKNSERETGMIKLGVLISGNGSNLQALIDAIQKGALDASIELVVSSRPDAFGIERAKAAGIDTLVLCREDYADPIVADRRIVAALKAAEIDYVVCAGYMRMLREPIFTAYYDRIINVHPALLPAFKGATGIKDAFEYGVKLTGVTIHFVTEEYDSGPIIAQQAVTIDEDDTLETLEEKIHAVEHILFPKTLQLLAQGRVAIDEMRIVRIS